MKIVLTLGEILEKYDWEAFCDLQGWDYYIIKDGRADSEEEYTLTTEEAKKIGVDFE